MMNAPKHQQDQQGVEPGVDIVICRSVHADVLSGLHRDCFEKPWDPPSFRELLEMAGDFGFIILIENAPAGFIVARQAQVEGVIITLGVLPEHRRCGFARTLIQTAESHLFNSGGRTMFLEVAKINQPAKILYEALGYRVVGRRKGYYKRQEDFVDALILHKTLTDNRSS